jgi:flagellar hook protein FlgE
MSILNALYSGVSGLTANGMAIAVIGDNISNVNTVGFKGSRILFQDMLSQSVLGGQLGRGTSPQVIDKQMAQGNLQPTSTVTDLAISGDGFFVLRGASGGQFFSRAGQFRLDAQGALVNPNGYVVQGYPESTSGLATGLGDLRFPSVQSPPQATTRAGITANLDSGAQAIAGGFSAADPTGTSNFSTGMTVYDSLGQAHTVTAYFTKTADNQWSWNVLAAPQELTAPTNPPTPVASGTLTFGTDGNISNAAQTTNSFNFTGAAQNQQIAVDFGAGLTGTTQFARASTVNQQTQDGYAAGVLQNLAIDKDGLVSGQFSNGTTRPLARIALATFQSTAGLEKAGGSLYRETVASGQALLGRPNQGPRGQVNSSSLELSNVDIANEFVSMITAQRAYQASSKTITTADSLLGEVINLKRS